MCDSLGVLRVMRQRESEWRVRVSVRVRVRLRVRVIIDEQSWGFVVGDGTGGGGREGGAGVVGDLAW